MLVVLVVQITDEQGSHGVADLCVDSGVLVQAQLHSTATLFVHIATKPWLDLWRHSPAVFTSTQCLQPAGVAGDADEGGRGAGHGRQPLPLHRLQAHPGRLQNVRSRRRPKDKGHGQGH